MKLKPVSPKILALITKLQALAERGIDGERIVAERKLARFKARYDFQAPDLESGPDLFSGTFARSRGARRIYSFHQNEFDIPNAVKWAIESATGIRCLHRGADLLAEATAPSARRLREICDHIAQTFRVLVAQYCRLGGVTAAARSAFLMGLYDGMMNETRGAGQRLPGGSAAHKKVKGRKKAPDGSAGVHIHPYTIGVGLGKQIRFSTPLEEITAELESVAPKCLPPERP